jgi:hypothetical protein
MILGVPFLQKSSRCELETRRTWCGDERGYLGEEMEEWGGDGCIYRTGMKYYGNVGA